MRARRLVLIGRRECGKSYYANHLIQSLRAEGGPMARALVWVKQPEARYTGRELWRIGDCRKFIHERTWVFRSPVQLLEVANLARQLRDRHPNQPIVLGVDELADTEVTNAEHEWRHPVMRELLQTVRGVSLVACTQTPADMPMALRQLADWYFLFDVTGDASFRRLEHDGVPAEKIAKLREGLPDRVYLSCKPGKW